MAGTASAVSGRVHRRQQERWSGQAAEQQQAQYEQQQAQAQYEQQLYEQQPQGAGGGGDDYAAEIERLAQLRTQGILTEEEFQAKKKQILGI